MPRRKPTPYADGNALEEIILAVGDVVEPVPIERPTPDFLWVGCGICFQPADAARPVRAYAEWLEDPMRHRPFFCKTCSTAANRHVEHFPTLWAMAVDHWWIFREGQEAPEPAEDVQRWGV